MGVLDLFVPERCAGCRAEGSAFCACCLQALILLPGPLCATCGAPVLWPVGRCRECSGRRLAFQRARAAVVYEGVAVRLLSAWKQGGRRSLARIAAELVGRVIPRPAVDAIAPVPAAPSRARWRGCDPPARLAAELAATWGLPTAALLARAGEPRPQRGLRLTDRRRNVAGAFRPLANAPEAVLVVDDVYTTGATANEAARALRLGGAHRVEVVTFARALRR